MASLIVLAHSSVLSTLKVIYIYRICMAGITSPWSATASLPNSVLVTFCFSLKLTMVGIHHRNWQML